MYGLKRPTYLCLKDDAHTDYYTAFATEELRATPPTVLCSVSLSSTVYTKTGNPAALVFIPICAGRRAGMWIIMNNYYTELKLSPESSLQEIQSELLRLEQLWRRREINSPETAAAKLVTITEAKRVFASESSRARYDRELDNSRKKPVTSDPKMERYALWKKWYDQARKYMNAEEWDLAKTAIEKALVYVDLNDEDPYFYNDCAYIYNRCGDYSTALSYANKAMVLDPDIPLSPLTKGMIYGTRYEKHDYREHAEGHTIIENERKNLKLAVDLAEKKNLHSVMGIAYGLLAVSYFRDIWGNESYYSTIGIDKDGNTFIMHQLPKEAKIAEDYATEAKLYGDEWGLGDKILSQIEAIYSNREAETKRVKQKWQKDQIEQKEFQKRRMAEEAQRQAEVEKDRRKHEAEQLAFQRRQEERAQKLAAKKKKSERKITLFVGIGIVLFVLSFTSLILSLLGVIKFGDFLKLGVFTVIYWVISIVVWIFKA